MYKVGDKVKVIARKHGHNFKIGQVVIIVDEGYDAKFHCTYWDCLSLDGDKSWFLEEDEFELFVEKKEEAKEYTHYQKTVLKAELKEQRLNYEQREL